MRERIENELAAMQRSGWLGREIVTRNRSQRHIIA
jgi:hypothetical protein